jgi:hypothetical protein
MMESLVAMFVGSCDFAGSISRVFSLIVGGGKDGLCGLLHKMGDC